MKHPMDLCELLIASISSLEGNFQRLTRPSAHVFICEGTIWLQT